MHFRQYDSNTATLKEWAKQLNVANKGTYPLYPTINQTLSNWKSTLNKNIGTNTFSLYGSDEQTISNWENKLNLIYNK